MSLFGISHMFDELEPFFGGMSSSLRSFGDGGDSIFDLSPRGLFHPFFAAPMHSHVNAYDTHVEVELEVPRYKMEDIKIQTDATRGTITIEGSRKAAARSTAAKGDNANKSQEGDKKNQQLQVQPRAQEEAGTTISQFRKSFEVSPRLFDLDKVESTLEHGVLHVKIPRRAEAVKALKERETAQTTHAQSVPLEGGAEGKKETKTTSEGSQSNAVAQLAPNTKLQWPPRFQMIERPNPDVLCTYVAQLPNNIPAENVSIQVDEGQRTVTVDMNYSVKKETANSYSEHSASFTRGFTLPEGAKKEHVAARLEKDGTLKIAIKDPKPKSGSATSGHDVPVS